MNDTATSLAIGSLEDLEQNAKESAEQLNAATSCNSNLGQNSKGT